MSRLRVAELCPCFYNVTATSAANYGPGNCTSGLPLGGLADRGWCLTSMITADPGG